MIKDKVLQIKAFSEEKYADIDLNSLIVFTINYLEEKNIQTSFENICITAYKFFPKKFALVGFPQYPDATRVNRALLQCRPKYQNLALGNVKEGFILTKMGEMRVKRAKMILSSADESKKPKLIKKQRVRTIDNYQKAETILNSKIYKKFISKRSDDIEEIEFYDLLGAGAYTSPKKLKEYFSDVKKIAIEADNKNLLVFLKSMQQKFQYLFKGD